MLSEGRLQDFDDDTLLVQKPFSFIFFAADQSDGIDAGRQVPDINVFCTSSLFPIHDDAAAIVNKHILVFSCRFDDNRLLKWFYDRKNFTRL